MVYGLSSKMQMLELMLTCRACGVEPFAWLRHVLTDDLLPFNFKNQPGPSSRLPRAMKRALTLQLSGARISSRYS